MARNVGAPRGSAIIFTETLAHGANRWQADEPRCRPLPITDYGGTDFPEQMVALGDNRLLQVNDNAYLTSDNEGVA